MSKNTIIVCAYSVYPYIKSSEGIVNKNWFDILDNQKETATYLLSTNTNIDVFTENKSATLKTIESAKLKFIYDFSFAKKKSFYGFLYSIGNVIFKFFHKKNNLLTWYQKRLIDIQKKNILEIINQKENVIVWARVLPMLSVIPVLEAYAKKKFPYIVNINDPLDLNADQYSRHEEQVLLKTIDSAQCWTFPSQRLANIMIDKYSLDSARCFVIPHAMRQQEQLYHGNKPTDRKLKFVYTGTFYKSAFTESFGKDLNKFCNTTQASQVEFTFILSQYDDYSLLWIKNNIPSATIHFKLSREEVLTITAQADCMLIVDSVFHQDLLKGKLIEAISLGLPIFAITYPNSVMDKVTIEYGGFSAYQNIEDSVFTVFLEITTKLRSKNWCDQFSINRQSVMHKISEKNIAKATIEIAQFANDRFLWKEKIKVLQPKIPTGYNWP
ncbi:hypothetical protein [Flavobacterium sp.]|uniref:hypothetical protein n=1 Tax=Flavobacterium sp. TaxID=239 RepID=UPI0037531D2E